MRLYVAGPMTGYPRWNFDAFELATAELRAAGYEVVSPAEVDLDLGFDPDAPVENYGPEHYRAAMRRDVEVLLTVDGIATLRGWGKSKGARVEVTVGRALGLPVQPVAAFLRQAKEYAL